MRRLPMPDTGTHFTHERDPMGSRLPGLAAGVPADEARVSNLRRDRLEPCAVAVPVDGELGDALAAPDNRDDGATRLVGHARLRPEDELARLDEEDPSPRAAFGPREV